MPETNVESHKLPGATWVFSKNEDCKHDGRKRRVHIGTFSAHTDDSIVVWGQQCSQCKGLLYDNGDGGVIPVV